jgi:lipoyl(octanoyl) transferase
MRLQKLSLLQEKCPRSAAENMAIDEALFLTASHPVLRSYRWVRPSVSFGYFALWEDVVSRFAERDLVRRWTGGGLVEHGKDFTYSLIYPGSAGAPQTIELYRFVHLAVATVLQKIGWPVEIAELTEQIRSPVCFEKAVQFDLKLGSQKIAGAAIRRNRRGLLLQGSIQHLELPPEFALMLAEVLGDRVQSFVASELTMERAAQAAKEKYGAAEWNRRR